MRSGTVTGCLSLAVLLLALCGWSARAQSGGNDLETRLGLADLAPYRAALLGKATADDPHASDPSRLVSFRDLWDHPATWRGRRVQVQGRVVRIFRQGALGSFPPLVEVWLSTPAGNLLCVVFPQDEGAERKSESPEPGKQVTFTGTFLKSIRYIAAAEPRLAPLIVGDRPPAPSAEAPAGEPTAATTLRAIGASPGPDRSMGQRFESWSPAAWMLGIALGLVATAVLAWQHLRKPGSVKPLVTRHQNEGPAPTDPPLEFIETEPMNGTVLPDARSH
jgi:hypothetical protein